MLYFCFVFIELEACIEGYFGTNCSRVCSPNCKPDTCRHTDGSCSCSPGWTGHNCTTGIKCKIVNSPFLPFM